MGESRRGRGFIDLHCDTISKLERLGSAYTLFHKDLCVNLQGLTKSQCLAQFFACFAEAGDYATCRERQTRQVAKATWDKAYEAILKMLTRLRREQNDKLRLVRTLGEIYDNRKQGVISAVATVEEGGILQGKLERLGKLDQQGVRLLTLTWKYENSLGSPCSWKQTLMKKGLKPFGYEVVTEMNRRGMLIDISHLSDAGFWDCVHYSQCPILASHSNARALCNHPRNLSDGMLRALAKQGGVVGLNFYPFFLEKNGQVSVHALAAHARHILQVGGEDLPAIGTDFDGFAGDIPVRYPAGSGDMEWVWEAFLGAKITPRQVDKIKQGNVLRLLGDVWGY